MEKMTADAYQDLLRRQTDEEQRKNGRTGRRNAHPEADLQELCLCWFRSQYANIAPLLFAVENGAKKERRYINGRWVCLGGVQAKKMGVTAGVSDLLLLIPRGGFGCLCVEMKTTARGSGQSDRQKAWQRATEAAGNKYVIVRTFEQFQAVIGEYLAL